MLHLSLLGEQAISDGSASLRAHSSRAAALVAFLVTHAGSPQARQRIAGLFWPESTDAQALTNLRRELHHLRQILRAEPSLVVTPRDLCWRDTETCLVDLRIFDIERQAAASAAAAGNDAEVIARGTAALAQYKGDLLPGQYDDWLIDVRAELDRQCADLCDLLAAARARAGDLAGAAAVARRRIQLQPLEEAGYCTLMMLLSDLGDRAGAVSTYHHCASVLERELGVVPGPATRQAFQRLMADGAGRRRVQPDSPPLHLGPARWPRNSSAGPASSVCSGTRGGRPPRAGRTGPGQWRRGCRQDAARGGDLRSGPAAWRRRGEQSVLRNLGAAGAGTGRRLAAQPGGTGRVGGAGPGLDGRGEAANAGRGTW